MDERDGAVPAIAPQTVVDTTQGLASPFEPVSWPVSDDPVRSPPSQRRFDEKACDEGRKTIALEGKQRRRKLGPKKRAGLLRKLTMNGARWQNREFHVWRDELCWYKPGSKQPSGRINIREIKLVSSNAGTSSNPNRFKISCRSRDLNLEASSSAQKEAWVYAITHNMAHLRRPSQIAVDEEKVSRLERAHTAPAKQGRSNTHSKKPWRYIPPSPRSNRDMSWIDYQDIAKTGDLIMFRTSTVQGALTRLVTGCSIDHIGVVLRSDGPGGKICILEALSGSGVISNQLFLFRLNKWCDQYSSTIVRQLKPPLPQRKAQAFIKFTEKAVGRGYSLLNAIWPSPTSPKAMNKAMNKATNQSSKLAVDKDTKGAKGQQPSKDYFCSELVASCYREIGLLPGLTSCANYMPGNFLASFNLQLMQGHSLGEEISIKWRD